MSYVLNEHPAPSGGASTSTALPLEDALAFADACELTSDEELGDFADVDIRDAFASSLTKDALFVDSLSLADPIADGAHSSVFFSTDAFFSSDMSMQELHTVDLGQITAMQAKSGIASNSNRHSSEPGATAASGTYKRSRAKSTGGTARARSTRRDSQSTSTRRQRASSSAAKPAPAPVAVAKVVPVTSDSGSNPPAKKRIRRQREELLYLREKVKVLERSLSTLRLDKPGDGDSASTTESSDSTDSASLVENEEDEEQSARIIADFEQRYKVETSSDAADAQASLWEGVASRQYGERERAEHENRHLKDALQKQIQLAKSLEQILQNQPTADVSLPVNSALRATARDHSVIRLTQSRFASLTMDQTQLLAMPDDFQALKLIANGDDQSDRDAVFDQLISEVSRAFDNFHLEVDTTTLAAMKREVDEVKVESCLQKGLAVRFSVHKHVPFSRQAVSNGMWKFIGLGGPKMESYYYREVRTAKLSYDSKPPRTAATNVVRGWACYSMARRRRTELRAALARRSRPGMRPSTSAGGTCWSAARSLVVTCSSGAEWSSPSSSLALRSTASASTSEDGWSSSRWTRLTGSCRRP